MKKIKFWLSTLCFVTLFSSASFANNAEPTDAGEPKTLTEQFHVLLENIDFSTLDEENEMLVDFIINSRGEILVLSTNNKNLDHSIKKSLNYKKLSTHNLVFNVRYTLPITFKTI